MTNLKAEAKNYSDLSKGLNRLSNKADKNALDITKTKSLLETLQESKKSMTQQALEIIFMASLNHKSWSDFWTDNKAQFKGKTKDSEAGPFVNFTQAANRAKGLATAIEQKLVIQYNDDENFSIEKILNMSLESLTLSTLADKAKEKLKELKDIEKALQDSNRQALELFFNEIKNSPKGETAKAFDKMTIDGILDCDDVKALEKSFPAAFIERFIEAGRKLHVPEPKTVEEKQAESQAIDYDKKIMEMLAFINEGKISPDQMITLQSAIKDSLSAGITAKKTA